MESANQRTPIPKEIRRELFVECGHRCSVPFCYENESLEFHHIDGNPSNNIKSNLIVFCPNHHAKADRGKIDRKECISYKERLEQIRPEETLKEKVEREGIDVSPENPFTSLILNLGRRYMNWRYGKPDASINREITILVILSLLCFIPLIYTTVVLKASALGTSMYIWSIALSAVGIALLGIFGLIYERRCPCPNCKGYFGIERIISKRVSEKEKYRTETEIIIEKIFHNTYRCVFCGHTYTKNEPKTERVRL